MVTRVIQVLWKLSEVSHYGKDPLMWHMPGLFISIYHSFCSLTLISTGSMRLKGGKVYNSMIGHGWSRTEFIPIHQNLFQYPSNLYSEWEPNQLIWLNKNLRSLSFLSVGSAWETVSTIKISWGSRLTTGLELFDPLPEYPQGKFVFVGYVLKNTPQIYSASQIEYVLEFVFWICNLVRCKLKKCKSRIGCNEPPFFRIGKYWN